MGTTLTIILIGIAVWLWFKYSEERSPAKQIERYSEAAESIYQKILNEDNVYLDELIKKDPKDFKLLLDTKKNAVKNMSKQVEEWRELKRDWIKLSTRYKSHPVEEQLQITKEWYDMLSAVSDRKLELTISAYSDKEVDFLEDIEEHEQFAIKLKEMKRTMKRRLENS